jgi:hypothetical protein
MNKVFLKKITNRDNRHIFIDVERQIVLTFQISIIALRNC